MMTAKKTVVAREKNDVTTKIARDIIDSEAHARIVKTERLRAARLAQELVAEPKPAKAAAPKKRAASKPKAGTAKAGTKKATKSA